MVLQSQTRSAVRESVWVKEKDLKKIAHTFVKDLSQIEVFVWQNFHEHLVFT